LNIQKNQIGLQRLDLLDRRDSGFGFVDDFNFRVAGEKGAQPVARGLLIVDQQRLSNDGSAITFSKSSTPSAVLPRNSGTRRFASPRTRRRTVSSGEAFTPRSISSKLR
jgi:hypothetical protein